MCKVVYFFILVVLFIIYKKVKKLKSKFENEKSTKINVGK